MRKLLLPGVLVAALALAGCAPATNTDAMDSQTTEQESMTEMPGNIVEVATEAGDFTTLLAAIEAAGLVETLEGPGPFTVFAPTDEAFAALPAGLLDALLLEENRDVLAQILTYHVVSGEVLAADVVAGDVPSVEGSAITVTTDNGVVLNGSAEVILTDVKASNGVIHAINAVILPPGLDVNALLG